MQRSGQEAGVLAVPGRHRGYGRCGPLLMGRWVYSVAEQGPSQQPVAMCSRYLQDLNQRPLHGHAGGPRGVEVGTRARDAIAAVFSAGHWILVYSVITTPGHAGEARDGAHDRETQPLQAKPLSLRVCSSFLFLHHTCLPAL